MASLRARLLVGAALGVSLAFVASGIAVFVLARSLLHEQFDETLAAKARALSLLVEQEPKGLEIEIDPDEVTSDTELYELWVGEAVLSRSTRLGSHHLPRMEPGIAAVALPFPGRWRQITLPFYPRDEPNEPTLSTTQVTLVLARSVDEVDGAVARVAKVLVGVGAVGTLVCLLIVAGVVRFGLSPLRVLARDIAALREDERLDARRSPAELRVLVARLNDLLSRLGATLARERELTAEVAHELRTPLAGLRTTIEVALGRERTGERYRETLANCLAIATQTEHTIETMLSLARLDAGAVARELAPTAIDELVRDVLAEHAARIAARGLTVTRELAVVNQPTDRAKLRVIVENLVANAVAYTEEGGAIAISLTGERLRIANTGTALAPADAERVFERFWRGDPARTIDSHAGLGLALARKLAEVIDATLEVTIAEGTFTVTVSWRSGQLSSGQAVPATT